MLNSEINQLEKIIAYANELGSEFESIASGDIWYSFSAKIWNEKRLYLNAKYGRRSKWNRDASGYIDLKTLQFRESGTYANSYERGVVSEIAEKVIEKLKS